MYDKELKQSIDALRSQVILATKAIQEILIGLKNKQHKFPIGDRIPKTKPLPNPKPFYVIPDRIKLNFRVMDGNKLEVEGIDYNVFTDKPNPQAGDKIVEGETIKISFTGKPEVWKSKEGDSNVTTWNEPEHNDFDEQEEINRANYEDFKRRGKEFKQREAQNEHPDYVCETPIDLYDIKKGDIFLYVNGLGYQNISNDNQSDNVFYTPDFFKVEYKDHFEIYEEKKDILFIQLYIYLYAYHLGTFIRIIK